MSNEADPLETMRRRYLERLAERQQAIRESWDEVTSSDWEAGAVSGLFVHVHKLTGSGATFGFPAITDAARPLEEHLKPFRDRGDRPSAEMKTRLCELLDGLLETLSNHVNKAPDPQPLKVTIPESTPTTDRRQVCLFSDDPQLPRDLESRLAPFGYSIECHPEGCTGETGAMPSAVLVDLDADASRFNAIETIGTVRERSSRTLPVIALSRHDNFSNRLAAARAGAETFFSLPFDGEALLRTLDETIIDDNHAPYRILLIDDDPDFVEFTTTVLEKEGMVVTALEEPERVMETLLEGKPDLVILDLYLGSLNGSEIAAVIRQHREFDDLPIVFVSAETDPVRRMRAIQTGGTAMLVKPLGAPDLIGTVTAQVRRFRKLRALMVRDGLTRLLNHTSIKEQIRMETARALRKRRPLALAMIDIDDFKKVNDTWGHPVGDQVLVNLSRLLRSRLRGGDVVARYGGEEFVVLFSETSPPQAQPILENILIQFRELLHETPKGSFKVTFSAGISGIPGHETADQLLRAADETLYRAKRAGKNRVLTDA